MNKLKRFVPPILSDYKRKIFPSKYGWFGDYSSWQEAKKECKGYEDEAIISKVKDAVLKVKNGEAVFERDSVIFDEIEYSWPTLAALNWIAAQHEGNLNIVDFGGSLGSTYFQNRRFLRLLKSVTWSVVEQEKFVEVGKLFFQNQELSFHLSIDDCFSENKPSAALFSGVLQYLEHPYQILSTTFNKGVAFVIVDLTGFTSNNEESKITIQKVNPIIYDATYPCWIFNKKEFVQYFLTNSYELIENFHSHLSFNYKGEHKKFEGFIFKRKK